MSNASPASASPSRFGRYVDPDTYELDAFAFRGRVFHVFGTLNERTEVFTAESIAEVVGEDAVPLADGDPLYASGDFAVECFYELARRAS